jgi:hypothetical protein
MIKGFKIVFAFLLILSIAGCTKKRYEWVKINPEKLHLAKTAKPYSESVRRVNIYISARQKAEILVYTDADTFLQQDAAPSAQPISKVNRPIKQNKIAKFGTPKKVVAKKVSAVALVKSAPAVKEYKQVKVAKPSVKEKTDEELALSKLNSALILPKKKPKQTIQPKETVAESVTPKEQTRQQAGVSQIFTDQADTKTPEATQTSPKVVERKEVTSSPTEEMVDASQADHLNAQSEEVENTEDGTFKRNNYMWVGLVLIIIGLIIGLVFGGMAYFISVVGVVFLLIGYFYKV